MSTRSKKTSASGKRKWLNLFAVLAIALTVAVLANMALIYFFSTESKEESGDRSSGIVQIVVYILYPNYDDLFWIDQMRIMDSTHHLVRKLAHFSEFGLLGFLSAWLVSYVNRRKHWFKTWPEWVIPAAFCLLYAISDEVHQIFSNRGPRVTDVLIDFSGAVCGILLIRGMIALFSRMRKGKRDKTKPKKHRRRKDPCETPDTN